MLFMWIHHMFSKGKQQGWLALKLSYVAYIKSNQFHFIGSQNHNHSASVRFTTFTFNSSGNYMEKHYG